jgi:hypothetical protein
MKMLELVKQDLMLSMKGALQKKKEMILVTEKMEALKVERNMILLKETMEKIKMQQKKVKMMRALIKMIELVMKKMVIMIHYHHRHRLVHSMSATGHKKSTATCLNLHH